MAAPTTTEEADAYVADWMAAWNSHDADRVAAHYGHEVEYHSPFVQRVTGQRMLRGRAAVRDYVAGALERYPELHFRGAEQVALGVDSVSFSYRSVNELLAIETLVFGDDGLVARAHCHYR